MPCVFRREFEMQSALGAEVLKRIHLLKADEGEECVFVSTQCDLGCVHARLQCPALAHPHSPR